MERPNVLFMCVDDLRPQLACYGHAQMHTPNFDRLAASGVLFERNVSQQPICMASRLSFMTGLRTDRHHFYDCRSLQDLKPDALTLNQVFADAGYTMRATGKIYHHDEDHPAQFGEAYCPTRGQTFGRGYRNPESQEAIARNSAEREARGLGPEDPTHGRGPCTERSRAEDSAFPDGQAAAWAVDQIAELATGEGPFFMSVGFVKPHLPFAVPERYWDLYEDDDLELPAERERPNEVPEYSQYNFGELRNYEDVPDGDAPLDEGLSRRLIHGYYAAVSFLDAQLGKVLDALDASPAAENTIVVLVVDHGFQLLEHGYWCKHTCYQPSYHVPLLIRAPGVTPAGGRVTGLSENVDLFPTLCELADLPVPEGLDGDSVLATLRDPVSGGKAAVFTQWPARARLEPEKVVMGYTVMTDAYRYTEWTQRASGEVCARELYDLASDPGEVDNIADAPEQLALQDELHALLLSIR